MSVFQNLGRWKEVKDSILSPHNAGLRFILSLNNTLGKAEGNPLMSTFDKKWRKVREESRGWFATKTGEYKLGAINNTAVQSDTWIIHMLCQDDNLQVDLEGLKKCLKKTYELAAFEKASVHVDQVLLDNIPELKGLLEEFFIKKGISVYLYKE